MPKITVFVGRSFSPEDEPKIIPILKHLDTFHPLGFTWETAEQAEMESVSLKVRRMIDAAQVFVGILTRRYPVYDLSERWRSAFRIATRNLLATRYTAPAWVIQEAGYAQKAGLKLILFREDGVEIPGLQGDLEYIEFAAGDYATAFQRASEMINREIGKQSGILVETSVSTVSPESENKEPSTGAPHPTAATTVDEKPGGFAELYLALREKKLNEAAEMYEAQAKKIAQDMPEHSVAFEALYDGLRFEAGDDHALANLRALAARAPDNPFPRARIADCLQSFDEFIPAAETFLEAADRSDGKRSSGYMVSAARAFRRGKHFLEARDILLNVINDERAGFNEQRGEALKELYELFKDSDERYHAVAIGELALHENPALSDFRFQLAYDCDEWNYTDISIHHYALLREKQPENAMAINNLGVAFSKRDLNISTVAAYKRAIELGETLAAKNLGFTYLHAGMADDAATLVKKAMESASSDPGLPEVLSAIGAKQTAELEKKKLLESSAEKHRIFAHLFSHGLLKPLRCDIGGTWKFPFAAMSLVLSGETLTGTGESSEEVESRLLSSLMSSSPGTPVRRTKKYLLSGQLLGSTCRFSVRTEPTPALGIIEPRDGYLVFSASCGFAHVVELKDALPHNYYDLNKT